MSVELLAPAGSPEALDAAIGEGADAVYLGLKNFNARMRSVNFTYSQFESALRSLRRMGKKLYVTVNTVFEQREADRVYQLLKYLSTVGPDALIVQDFGILAMIQSEFPKLKIHASTQMNIASGRGANTLSRYNVSRVVLARELGLEELRSIRAETNMELEVFVHGALCVSASGLCLFSGYLGGKSANRGMCTQACRRLYRHSEESGYYFSPADLQLLERLPELVSAGINALKIEGRMKSADYVGAVVRAYRLVLDSIAEGSPNEMGGDEKIMRNIAEGGEILRGDFARSKTQFYYGLTQPQEKPAIPNWLNPDQDGGTGINLGVIQKVRKMGELKLGLVREGHHNGSLAGSLAGSVAVGDSIRLHRRDDSERVTHKIKHAEPGGKEGYWLSIPDGFRAGDSVYLIQNKAMSKRYKPVISGERKTGHREPGFDKSPHVQISLPQKNETPARSKGRGKPAFPEGLYVAVSNINDLYIVQSSRPEKVMLYLNRKTTNYLLSEGKPPLPFKPADIIPVLDPYFPQADNETLSDTVHQLIETGHRQFMVNNPGHFSFFRNFRSDVQLIAGPWLYMFNTWALSFVASLGVDAFVSPFENNRQNLERTLECVRTGDTEKRTRSPGMNIARSLFFIPVFAWPSLFRIRADLGTLYDFNSFSDNQEENFHLITSPEGSSVIPEKPFSITDKIPFLKEAGFKRFIIDLSGPPLKKNDYKDLMGAVNAGTPLPHISRFNWKDGFFSTENSLNSSHKDTEFTKSTKFN